MKPTLVLLCLATLAACGPDYPEPAPGVVNASLAGAWTGTLTTLVDDGTPYTEHHTQQTITLHVEGTAVTVMGTCPESSAAWNLVATGAGKSATWSGQAKCNTPASACPDRAFEFYSTALNLEGGGDLVVVSRGWLRGCGGTDKPVTSTFRGTKQ